jgi:hypothetical protein
MLVKELVGMKFLRIQEKRLKRVSKECVRSHTKPESGMLEKVRDPWSAGLLMRTMPGCVLSTIRWRTAVWPKGLQDRTMAKNSERVCE